MPCFAPAVRVFGLVLIAGMLASAAQPAGASEAAPETTRRAPPRDVPHGAPSDVDFRWSGRLSPGKMIEIKGVSGDIDAEASNADEVLVTANKHGHRDDPREVKIEFIEHRGGVTVCAIYPNRWGAPYRCRPGPGGGLQAGNNDVLVDFHVRVPAGVRFVGRDVNGWIKAEGLKGPVEAYTVNGSVQISTEGVARATTVNGSISTSVGVSSWSDRIELSTVNGSISATFPPKLSAQLRAQTRNGDIATDFPLTGNGKPGGRRLEARIGNGSPGRLWLSTVNGSIRLLSSP